MIPAPSIEAIKSIQPNTLAYCIQHNDKDGFRKLLCHTSIRKRDGMNLLPVDYCILFDNQEMLKILIDHAISSSGSFRGDDAVSAAIKFKNVRVINNLFEDQHVRFESMYSVLERKTLEFIVEFGDDQSLLHLLEFGPNSNAMNAALAKAMELELSSKALALSNKGAKIESDELK